ncbi:MAG: lactonase family protein [Vicinamibacterales bacterium]
MAAALLAGLWHRGTARATTTRLLLWTLAATIAASAPALGQQAEGDPSPARSALYAAAGAVITHYDVQVDPPALVKKASLTVPGVVQYAWPHPSHRFLYVVWSDGPSEHPNGLSAFRLDASGSLHEHGAPVFLKARSIFLTTDIAGRHVLVAYNTPSSLSVHRLGGDGTIGAEVPQPPGLDAGIYAHQVRVHPSDGTVVLVARGNMPTPKRAENPGSVKLLSYKDGVLSNRASIAPAGGYGFQPRDVDFHPSGKWVFVSLEPQNQLQVYRQSPDGLLETTPAFVKDSLPAPVRARAGFYQRSGAVHAHPNGRFVYQADRATDETDGQGTSAWGGGTNAIGVFDVNQTTGEPTLIQTADTHGFVPRTFALDASATILVAGNQDRVEVRDSAARAQSVPPSLALFRVLPNGKLDYLRRYDVEGNADLFWMGIVPLPR